MRGMKLRDANIIMMKSKCHSYWKTIIQFYMSPLGIIGSVVKILLLDTITGLQIQLYWNSSFPAILQGQRRITDKKESLWTRFLSFNPSWPPFSTGDCTGLGGNMTRNG